MPLIKGKSKKSFGKNVEKEMDAGKPQDQALAIAYQVQRKNKKKKMYDGGEVLDADSTGADSKKMLKGAKTEGSQEITANQDKMYSIDDEKDHREMAMVEGAKASHSDELDVRDEKMSGIDDSYDSRDKSMLEGKPSSHKDELLATDEDEAVADDHSERSLQMLAEGGMVGKPKSVSEAIRRKKMMAEGGQVDLQDNDNEQLNLEDRLSYGAARKDTYGDLSQLDAQSEDSNEHGDKLSDEDEHNSSMIASIMGKLRKKRIESDHS